MASSTGAEVAEDGVTTRGDAGVSKTGDTGVMTVTIIEIEAVTTRWARGGRSM